MVFLFFLILNILISCKPFFLLLVQNARPAVQLRDIISNKVYYGLHPGLLKRRADDRLRFFLHPAQVF